MRRGVVLVFIGVLAFGRAAAECRCPCGRPTTEEVRRRLVPSYVENLRHPDLTVRWYAAEWLGEAGAVAREAIPALERALADPEWLVREEASTALSKIRSQRGHQGGR